MRTFETRRSDPAHGSPRRRSSATDEAGPLRVSPDTALQLQRSAGNTAVASAILVQRKQLKDDLKGKSTPYFSGGQITGVLFDEQGQDKGHIGIRITGKAPKGWLDFED
jgi:hypothetical protein